MKKTLLTISALTAAVSANATIMAFWDMNTFDGGAFEAGEVPILASSDIVIGTPSISLSSPIDKEDWIEGTDNAGSLRLRDDTEGGQYWTLDINTTGFENLQISFNFDGQAGDRVDNTLQYSINGVDFTNFQTFTPGGAYTGVLSYDLTAISGLDNNSSAAFRYLYGSATDGNGDTFVWDVTVEGNAVPEPSTYALLFGGLSLGIILIRRRMRN